MHAFAAQNHSAEYKNLFNVSKSKFAHMPKPNSEEIWKKFDQELLALSSELTTPHSRDSKVKYREKNANSYYDKVNNAASRYSTVDVDFCDFQTIRSLVTRMHKSSHRTAAYSEGDIVPILNPASASTSDLRTLLSLFMPDVPESDTKEQLVQKVSDFIPVTAIQAPSAPKYTSKKCAGCTQKLPWYKKKFNACDWCSQGFCAHCPLEDYQFSRIGLNLRQLCNQCIRDLTRADADDWATASMKFLMKTDDESILASLGCASIAVALGAGSIDVLKNMAKELHRQGLHELAYNIISLVIMECESKGTDKEKMRVHHLASSILKSLAQDSKKTWEEKWNFAFASKESYLTAVSTMPSDTEFLDTRKQEIETLVQQLLEEKSREHEKKIIQYTMNLKLLWEQRNILGMLSYLKETSTECNNSTTVLTEDASLKAFQNFVRSMEPYLSSMLPDDRQALLFLKGVLKLKEENIDRAVADFESTAWDSFQANVSKEVIFGAYLCLMTEQNSGLYSYTGMKEVFQSGSKALLFSPPQKASTKERSTSLLFVTEEELSPPFKAKWPSISIVGHNTRCHEKYEEAVLELYKQKKWTIMRVAWAIIDQLPGCEHPAEMAVCCLHAAMWFLKVLDERPKIEPSFLFGIKCVIMKLIELAYPIALLFLNPGMELYVIRLALGIIRKIALMPNSRLVLTAEDARFIQILSMRLVKASKLFPFWNPPPVSVSEAVMLNLVTRNLYSSFILALEEINPDHGPLTSLDVKYQLYEYDLRSILPLENSSDARSRAMEELLHSQSWSWNDVVNILSSPLSPRDSDGWLIQSPHLGIPQQYSEITGFIIDTDSEHPSIELLVVEADPRRGRIGLFSQEDINTMLQLNDSDFPLYFSLDPPEHDLDKRYHPFQQWRYATEKVKDTEVLNTMFITDYLMKSFTVGSDVSAQPPFKQRPCKRGLTKNLPPKLQEAIRSIHERGSVCSQKTHRFWIEAKEMKYDCQQKESKIEFRFSEMEMIVKSHCLFRRDDGKLADTDDDDDPDSPHAKFARDMTENYEELGQYFPQFARLRQLSKLQIFAQMVQSVLQNLKESAEGKNVTVPKELVKVIQEDARKHHYTNISTALTKLKEDVGTWPKAQDRSFIQSKVDEIKNEMYREMDREEQRLRRIHGYNVIIDNSDAMSMLNNIESKVINAIRSNDEQILSQVTEALKNSLDIKHDYRLKQYIRNWLSDHGRLRTSQTPREVLIQYLCSHLPVPTHDDIFQIIVDRHHQRYQALSNLVDGYKSRKPHKANSCKWVPAAVSSQMFSVSYGGVAFTPKVVSVKDGQRLPRSRNEMTIWIRRMSTISGKTRSNTNYTSPVGKAEPKKSDRRSGQNSSWNDADSDDGGGSGGSVRFPKEAAAATANDDQRKRSTATKKDTQATSTMNEVQVIAKKCPAKKPVIVSTSFRGKYSTGVNDQLDKFFHGFHSVISKPSQVPQAAGGSNRPPRGPPGAPPRDPPGGCGGGKSGGGGSNKPPGPPRGRFIEGCKGRFAKACKSPSQIIKPIIDGLQLPAVPTDGKPRIADKGEKINAIYVMKNRRTGEVYVGRSCDVFRRIGQHQNDIRKGGKTVGKFIKDVEDVEFCILDLPKGLSTTEMRFYEQDVLMALKRNGYKVMNAINAMNLDTYNEMKKNI